MKRILLVTNIIFHSISSFAQHSIKGVVKDKVTGELLPDVTIGIKNTAKGSFTDSAGRFFLNDLPSGKYEMVVSLMGYEHQTTALQLPDTNTLVILLSPDENTLGEVVIASTRDDRRAENAPVKVEVVDREEMKEEQATRPANVIGVLGDVAGIKVQQTSSVTNSANIRIQGLEGRYTQVLRDGFPLYDGLSGGFSILQTPPLDLRQIEIIKGAASTLYGGGAIGGLINFISKSPTVNQDGELIVNATSLNELTANSFFAKRNDKWGYTFFIDYTRQKSTDVNKDGFSDVPELKTFIVHPKVFYYPDDKTTISLGYAGTMETRKGGDMKVLAGNADAIHQYYEADNTGRNTGELRIDRNFENKTKATLKASASSFDDEVRTNTHYFNGNQLNYYAEASVAIPVNKCDWVIGTNVNGITFTKRNSDPTPLVDFGNTTIGTFGQFTAQLPKNTTAQLGLRVDDNDKYGNFVLPAVALIHPFNNGFALRAGFGMGYKIPNALEQQNVEYSIKQLLPIADSVKPEYSYGYNLEVNYKKYWRADKMVFINTSFFLTQIEHPIVATELANENVMFANAPRPILTRGFDVYSKARIERLELYLGYTYTLAERKYLQNNQFIPLTPGNRIAFSSTYGIEKKWRAGLEADYSGSQYRDGQTKTPDYFLMAVIAEKDFGRRLGFILNVENIFDYRQSKVEALYTGSITRPSFRPLWAPTDGRVMSISIRLRL